MESSALEQDLHELDVIGGYDQDIGEDTVRRTLPEWDVAAVKKLTNREQVRQYLMSLPDDFLIKTYRHIQYRLLSDGTAWDFYGFAFVRRNLEGPVSVDAAQVTALPQVDAQTEQDYAMGWRPLGPPKVTENPCPKCYGHGVCSCCLGTGSA